MLEGCEYNLAFVLVPTSQATNQHRSIADELG